MTVNSPSSDTPTLLAQESSLISLNFELTGLSTAKVSWNIPYSNNDQCVSATDKANSKYCGMLITLGNTPALSTDIPNDTVLYTADPTADPNLHVGDKLGSSLIVGAFYQDKSTNSINISGVNPNLPYYAQGYTVDCQYRYNTQSINAYEQSQTSKKNPDLPATQIISFPNPISASDATNLVPGQIYKFQIIIDGKSYTLNINGLYAQTYGDLTNEINKQLMLATGALSSSFAPNTGVYYWNDKLKKLYQWDGSKLIEQTPLFNIPTDPSLLSIGEIWVDPTDIYHIKTWNGITWITSNYINYNHDPKQPNCDDYWFDGANTYQWDGIVWNKLNTIVNNIDPCVSAMNTTCGMYWYNQQSLFKRDNNQWLKTSALYWPTDPLHPTVQTNTIDGTFWFNPNTSILSEYTSTSWIGQGVIVSTTIPNSPILPSALFWYNPKTEVLKKYDTINLVFNTVEVIVWNTDPSTGSSGSLWWNSVNDNLYSYDIISNTWVQVLNFTQSIIDPTTVPLFSENQIWYNPDTHILSIWSGANWNQIDYINYPTDPRNPATNAVWYNNSNNTWYKYNGTSWIQTAPITSTIDPNNIPTGAFWYDGTHLFQRNGLSWQPVNFTTTNPAPPVDTLWFDTTTNQLKKWNGNAWVSIPGLATATIDMCGNLVITSGTVGGCSSISTIYNPADNNFLLTVLHAKVFEPTGGIDGLDNTPMYMQNGVGTNNSSEERKLIKDQILLSLGYPMVEVELNDAQLNLAIDNAVQTLRKRSAIGYKRGYFVLEVKPNVQKYILTNKCVGYNTIVDVLTLHRLSTVFTGGGQTFTDPFAQGMIQQLYFGASGTNGFDLLSYDLMSQYINLLEISFATRLQYHWNEQTRELWILNVFGTSEKILVDATIERTEQDLMTDRYTGNWIQKFALAQAMQILAQVRGKFSTLPGAGGNISLNSADLQSQADSAIEALLLQIDEYVVEDLATIGMGSSIVWG